MLQVIAFFIVTEFEKAKSRALESKYSVSLRKLPGNLEALHSSSYKKMFRKHSANLQENTHAEVRFQKSCKGTLLKLHFGMGFLLQICCIFS